MNNESDLPRVNFRISSAARAGIEWLRARQDKETGSKTGFVSVSWAVVELNNGRTFETLLVGFYDQSQDDEVRHGVQVVDGVPLIFFTTEKYAPLFEGQVIDFKDERFFLRPAASQEDP